MIYSALATLFCYTVPKIARFLTTLPDEGDRSTLHAVRTTFAHYHSQLREVVGQKNWNAFSVVVIDNAWVSVLVTSLIVNKPIIGDVELAKTLLPACIGVATLSWAFRSEISNTFPSTASILAPREVIP